MVDITILMLGLFSGNDMCYILKNCGMPIRKNGTVVGYGDLIIKFIINLSGLEYHHKQAILDILDKPL